MLNPSDRAIASIRKNKFLRMHRQAVQRFSATFAKRRRYIEVIASQVRTLGYGTPHLSTRGTSTLLNNALLSAHFRIADDHTLNRQHRLALRPDKSAFPREGRRITARIASLALFCEGIVVHRVVAGLHKMPTQGGLSCTPNVHP